MIQRYAYINTAKKLTAPLLDAYSAMIKINTRVKTTFPSHEVEALPLYDHHPQDTHTAHGPPHNGLSPRYGTPSTLTPWQRGFKRLN